MIFNNPWIVGICVPLIFLVSGGFAKKLVRGTPWRADDFYFGVESTLSSMASGLVYIYDLAKDPHVGPEKYTATTTFIVVSFFLLLLVIATHQTWESNPSIVKRNLYLGVLCNIIGSGLMMAFVILVKGT